MSAIRGRGEVVRRFILENVDAKGAEIAKRAAEKFNISRQAVNKHMQRLVSEGCLTEFGNTRNRVYKLAPMSTWLESYALPPKHGEDVVWSKDAKEHLGAVPNNVMDIWRYGFTEIFNNAIDHSEGTRVIVSITRTAINTEMLISDNGVGIFRKIQAKFGLLDERQAILELSKGKLTTDPKRHSGEGIFFTSRMFDSFNIRSGEVFYAHGIDDKWDWLSGDESNSRGTSVFLKLDNHTSRTQKKIFDKFSGGEDYVFNKTMVPVRLAQYGNDKLVSRSQAKRVLARVDLFKTVLFDFKDVATVGQAFADEIFRVFALAHPQIEIYAVHANAEVTKMIDRAKANLAAGLDAPPV